MSDANCTGYKQYKQTIRNMYECTNKKGIISYRYARSVDLECTGRQLKKPVAIIPANLNIAKASTKLAEASETYFNQ